MYKNGFLISMISFQKLGKNISVFTFFFYCMHILTNINCWTQADCKLFFEEKPMVLLIYPTYRICRRRQWHPTPVLLPRKSHGWRSLVGLHGVAKSRTWLSDFTFTFPFHALEKEMATHSSVLAWRIPGTGEPGWLPSMGSHRVGHDWNDLAAAAWGPRSYSEPTHQQ